jgi:hypothetical protein
MNTEGKSIVFAGVSTGTLYHGVIKYATLRISEKIQENLQIFRRAL